MREQRVEEGRRCECVPSVFLSVFLFLESGKTGWWERGERERERWKKK
jgi:hypothetical protein